MSKKLSLFNNKTFLFIFVFVICLILVIIYDVIDPNQPEVKPYFVPFPEGMNPSSYSENRGDKKDCSSQFPICNFGVSNKPDSNCTELCGDSNYICKKLSKGTEIESTDKDKKVSKFTADGVKSYCVPSSMNEKNCNRFTSTMVWDGNDNTWECKCKYPSLYGDETQGCIVKHACRNTSVISENLLPDQSTNRLVATKYAEQATANLSESDQIKEGDIWDPNDPKSKPSVLKYSPYTVALDEEADPETSELKPWFVCSCDKDNSVLSYNSLPDDPYSCHVDPCWSSYGHMKSGLQDVNTKQECDYNSNECECKCTDQEGPEGEFAKIPNEIRIPDSDIYKYPREELTCDQNNQNCKRKINSQYSGQCFVVKDQCGKNSNGFDYQTGTCICTEESKGSERKCQSKFVNVNTDLPFCKNPLNIIGSECQDCVENYCENDSICSWGLLHQNDKWPQQICKCPNNYSNDKNNFCYEGCENKSGSKSCKVEKDKDGKYVLTEADYLGGFLLNKVDSPDEKPQAMLDNRCVNKSCKPGTKIADVSYSKWWNDPTWTPSPPPDSSGVGGYWNESICPGGIACPVGECDITYIEGCDIDYTCAPPYLDYKGELPVQCGSDGYCTNSTGMKTDIKCDPNNTDPNNAKSCINQFGLNVDDSKQKKAKTHDEVSKVCQKPGRILDEDNDFCKIEFLDVNTDPGVGGSYKRTTLDEWAWCCGRQTNLSGIDASKIGERGTCYGNVKYDDSMKGDGIVNPQGHCAAGGKAASENRCYRDSLKSKLEKQIAPTTVKYSITNPITATEWEHQNNSK